MEILLSNLGRRYNKHWIFSGLTRRFSFPDNYAIIGSNGSGKSTLLLLISGYLSSSEGKVEYFQNGRTILPEQIYRFISYTAPYLDIPSQFTVHEFLRFHFGLKPSNSTLSIQLMLEESGLKEHTHKSILQLSSGMLQRLKLITAFGSDCPVILMDEPTINLDEMGIEWFRKMFISLASVRTLILGSNTRLEYDLCKHLIQIEDYKPS